jgi:predicted ferric reductase
MTNREVMVPPDPAAQPRPHASPLKAWDPVWLLAVNVGVIGFMWYQHGGIDRISNHGWLIAIGQLCGLFGAAAILLGLLLSSRTPWIERRYGMDRMIYLHRYVGFAAIGLVSLHVVSVTLGYAWDSKISVWDQIVDSYLHYPYVANAVIGFGLLIVVGIVSLRVLRRLLAYEYWWLIHMSVYAAVALAFGHQTATGSDFVMDGWAMAYWSLLYLSVAVLVLGSRWMAPVMLFARHRFCVVGVEAEGEGVVTIVISGRGLGRMRAQAGQFFELRALTASLWWKAHPFSLSAPPDGRTLRFTVKALGDDTTRLQAIEKGTRCILEGPYGGFLPHRTSDRKSLYIAGGVGITPFRGIVEDVDRPQDLALLYRNRTPEDTIFHDELITLSEELGFELRFSYSAPKYSDPQPFASEQLTSFLPDIADREVFVVGSTRLVASARSGLRAAGVPRSRIHYESFSF